MSRSRPSRHSVPRSRSGMLGRHFPRTGTEPVTAQSALGLRIVLAFSALVLFALASAALGVWASTVPPDGSPGAGELTVLAVACGALCLLAGVNLGFLLRRRRRELPPKRER
ncbi:DUF6343 family protein [Streptomyces sp. CC208A]|uniref:DUF6343 family protein n=1 Tax=Streptomyces sp. CC208A TaxID=3044573 RepID=UPI0024A80890|nr:DUF6343 family protein [Streptomyces sp. CC208A]